MHQWETQGDHVEAIIEEDIRETINIKGSYGQGTELLNSPLIKREQMFRCESESSQRGKREQAWMLS